MTLTLIGLIGVGLYLLGHGITKIPNTGVVGGVCMIVGGALVLISGFVAV